MIDINKITSDKDKLEISQLFRRFKLTPCDQEGNLIINFTNFFNQTIFPKGTNTEEVESYFDIVYPGGVNSLKQV
jgi:hypothetical protein